MKNKTDKKIHLYASKKFKMRKSQVLLCFFLAIILGSCAVKEKVQDEIRIIENSLYYPIRVEGETKTFSITERMRHYKVPGISVAVVKDGKLHWSKAWGISNSETKTAVTSNTLFQAGSISKPIAALAVLKLFEEGKIDLDQNINKYLKTWKIPENKFTQNEKVTPRRLLNHTAGTTVSGFPGYSSNDPNPTTYEVLKGKGNTDAVIVDTIPGSRWNYSGGGYTILQKVVEDVTGLPFEDYMQQTILEPLGMKTSTYDQPLPEGLHKIASAAYDSEGKIIEGQWHNYPEKAAAGLWTTPEDLAQYNMHIQEIVRGKDGILSKETIEKMLKPYQFGWGLGPQLEKEGDSLVFQHGGKNAGFTNMSLAFANKGAALVVMTNGDNGRNLLSEIVRAISEYYDWGLESTRLIKPIEISSPEMLVKFAGKYKFHSDSKEIVVHVVRTNDRLLLRKNSGEETSLIPIEENKFIELQTGAEYSFVNGVDNEIASFIQNDQMEFLKVL